MAVVINGSGTVTGLAVGGLPDGTVDTDTLATDSVTAAKIPASLENTFVSGRKNLIINGGFDVWQRGNSFSGSEYSADRWAQSLSGGTATTTQETFTLGQTDVPDNPTYYLKQDCSVGNNNLGINQPIEDVRNGAGQNVTVSFYAKGTNPNGGTFDLQLLQRFGSGGSATITTSTTLSINSGWTKHTHTFTVPSITGKTIGTGSNLDFTIRQTSTDTSTNAWELNVANVQVELGDTATDFEHRSYGEELALCQRYYEKGYAQGSGAYIINHIVNAKQSFIATKRAVPTITFSGTSTVYVSGTTPSTSAQSTDNIHVDGFYSRVTTSGTTNSGKACTVYGVDYYADAEL